MSVSVAASAGTAPAIEPSSLMARAASVAIAASASSRKRATPACFMRPSATTAAERTAGFDVRRQRLERLGVADRRERDGADVLDVDVVAVVVGQHVDDAPAPPGLWTVRAIASAAK